jgi:hypothetical protein
MSKAAAICPTSSRTPPVRLIGNKTAKNEVCRCSQQVREIPLEQFKLDRDGRKWKSAARNRYNLLLRLSTHANGDGTFLSPDGKRNFSPSMERLQEHYARRTLYRLMNELQELGMLPWRREKNHYGRRIYEIKMPDDGGNYVDKPDVKHQEQVPHSQEQVPHSQEQVPQLRTPSVSSPPSPPKEGKTYGAGAPNSTYTPIKTEQRKRYGIIGRLAGRAEFLLKQNPNLDRGDLAEQLKDWAASSKMPYFWPSTGHSPIEQAIVITEERLAATGSARFKAEKNFPPVRAMEVKHRRASA